MIWPPVDSPPMAARSGPGCSVGAAASLAKTFSNVAPGCTLLSP